MLACCGRGTIKDRGVVIPATEPELPETPQRNSEPTPATDPVAPAGTPQRKDSGASSKDLYPSLTAAANGRPDAFTVTLRRGNGQTLPLSVYPEQTVDQLHQQISFALGPGLPAYAIRLIFKSKVISMYGSQTVGSFGVAEGDILQLVVVRPRRPHTRDRSLVALQRMSSAPRLSMALGPQCLMTCRDCVGWMRLACVRR